jgi:CHAT domain-containing protein
LQELHERIWIPLEKAFPKATRKIVISPDGVLHFLPWAALLDDQETFLIERWTISRVGSGRDLARESTARSDKTLLALADGKDDLPYSRKEVDALSRIAKSHAWQPTLLVGSQGSESALQKYPHPRILHFATHGGEQNIEQSSDSQNRPGNNPMYRGFLLLGNHNQGRQSSDDGILTAEEATGLDLSGTWLTVLSACRSGAGDARIGEGVLGLRRGFTLAGTENLLFTLWSVDDEPTAQFMEAFYEKLFASGDVSESFRNTQIDELRLWKRALGVREAVFRAGGFSLTK